MENVFGMINNGKALRNMQMYREEKVIEIHPYAITQLSGTDGRYSTYVKEGEKRKLLRAASRKELFDFYFVQNSISSLTMEQLF